MYATANQGHSVYKSSAAEHVVDTADGYALIQSLMTRLIARLAMARHCLKEGDIPAKGEHLGQAVAIIGVLQVAIDEQHDQQLAGNLVALYDYMARQLLAANLRNDAAIIDEVEGLIREVKQAWDAIGEQLPAKAGG